MKKLFILALSAVIALASCTKEGNLDGKWSAPRTDDQPDDIAVGLIFDGNKLDLYICSWGWHFEGTYTYANETVKYNITKGYAALSNVEKDEDGKIIGYHGGIDAIDHKTLELNPGFDWYDMLDYRPDLYEEYVESLSSFSFEIVADGKAKSNMIGLMDSTFSKVK